MLVTNDVIRNRNQHLEKLVDEWVDIDSRRKGLTGAAIGDAMIIRKLMRKLKTEKIDRAVFNTAQGGHVRNACLFSLFRGIEFVGIIHTVRKFQGSFTQKVINLKIKKYFVLSAFLKKQIPERKNIQIEVFYPLDFPIIPNDFQSNEHIHISLIGAVENRRKDLNGFISLIQQCDSSVRFSFLGKADLSNNEVIEFKKSLAEINCLDRVEFYDKHVDLDTFNRILRKTNAILPLIHPHTPSADEYFRNQISGAMNIALGYEIPLLLHSSFRKIEELNRASVYYELDAFSGALDEIKSKGKCIRETMRLTEKYTSEYHHNTYLKFLFDL